MLRVAASAVMLAALAACASEPAPTERAVPAEPCAAGERAAAPDDASPAAHPRPGTDVVSPALAWLASRQAPDGSWDGDAGTTGLVLLAFLGTGETHQTGTHRDVVRRGLKHLCDRQDADGCFVPRASPEFPRDQALASLALCEAYGLTSSFLFRESARRSVEFAMTTRAAGGGWIRAGPDGHELDVETTWWMALLFHSAETSEAGEKGTFAAAGAAAVAALDRVTDPATGRVGADATGLGTEMALLVRILAGRTPANDPLLRRMADSVLETPPSVGTARDVLRTYLGTMSLYQFGGRRWRAWAEPMVEATFGGVRFVDGDVELVAWEPRGNGTGAGPVRATALCCMTLSVFYRIGDKEGWRRDGEKWNE